MTPLDAETRLEKMTQHETEPKLDTGDISLLLQIYRRTDKNGIAPGETDWLPTYDLKAAAAEGWRWKAAKASELVSADLDGERLSSNQVFDQCERMVKMYSGHKSMSLSIGK